MKTALILAALALPATAFAQTTDQRTAGSSSATPTGGDVSASTYGSGTTDADSLDVTSGGAAEATNGGTATTDSRAKFNTQNAHARSVAKARDDDERARSMTNTHVRRDGEIRSRSMSIYKQKGEKPVIDRDSSVSQPDSGS